jgi:hypothetical protein
VSVFLESSQGFLMFSDVADLLELILFLGVLFDEELFFEFLDVLLDFFEHSANLKLIVGQVIDEHSLITNTSALMSLICFILLLMLLLFILTIFLDVEVLIISGLFLTTIIDEVLIILVDPCTNAFTSGFGRWAALCPFSFRSGTTPSSCLILSVRFSLAFRSWQSIGLLILIIECIICILKWFVPFLLFSHNIFSHVDIFLGLVIFNYSLSTTFLAPNTSASLHWSEFGINIDIILLIIVLTM